MKIETKKHHYRAVFKSDHLSSADLEDFIEQGQKLVFTIKEVRQEFDVAVAGKKGNFNIAYFVENIKPLVLNSTNSKVIKSFCNGSPFVEDWKNIIIELYSDYNVKMKGEIVAGIRIKPIQPKTELPMFTTAMFEKAKNANASIDAIKKKYSVTADIEAQYKEYVTKK
jgi:hypothetical protein